MICRHFCHTHARETFHAHAREAAHAHRVKIMECLCSWRLSRARARGEVHEHEHFIQICILDTSQSRKLEPNMWLGLVSRIGIGVPEAKMNFKCHQSPNQSWFWLSNLVQHLQNNIAVCNSKSHYNIRLDRLQETKCLVQPFLNQRRSGLILSKGHLYWLKYFP